MRAHMLSGGTAPYNLYIGSTLGWVVNFTLRLLFSGKEVWASIEQKAGLS